MLPEVVRTDRDEEAMFLGREEACSIIERMRGAYRLPALLLLAMGMRPLVLRALAREPASDDAVEFVLRGDRLELLRVRRCAVWGLDGARFRLLGVFGRG